MEIQSVTALEVRCQRLLELRVGEQPRDFVFVLAGQQLEVVACHGFRQRRSASADS